MYITILEMEYMYIRKKKYFDADQIGQINSEIDYLPVGLENPVIITNNPSGS